MTRFPMAAALGSTLFATALLVSACAPTLGPPPPGGYNRPRPPGADPARFSAEQFAWSQRPGRNSITGRVAYQGMSCAGMSVVLTPDTPWSRARMAHLYGSTERAAVPADAVRARTPSAPPGDVGPYIKRTTCDGSGQFAVGGLPDGGWFVITVARPPGRPGADTVAVMRRVVTRGGRVTQVAL